jgi:hypothetical protein
MIGVAFALVLASLTAISRAGESAVTHSATGESPLSEA